MKNKQEKRLKELINNYLEPIHMTYDQFKAKYCRGIDDFTIAHGTLAGWAQVTLGIPLEYILDSLKEVLDRPKLNH